MSAWTTRSRPPTATILLPAKAKVSGFVEGRLASSSSRLCTRTVQPLGAAQLTSDTSAPLRTTNELASIDPPRDTTALRWMVIEPYAPAAIVRVAPAGTSTSTLPGLTVGGAGRVTIGRAIGVNDAPATVPTPFQLLKKPLACRVASRPSVRRSVAIGATTEPPRTTTVALLPTAPPLTV